MHPILEQVTERITRRSAESRGAYEARMVAAADAGVARGRLACGNLAHGFAACGAGEKAALRGNAIPNLAIVSAYNDMLSAHQPFERFPGVIKAAAREARAVAQFAGGVPAMCDGITQGQVGMELSLASRDVIALSTAIALSHAMFDGVLCLGICDKIVPGLLMGSLSFGHVPVVFVPGGPMGSGVPNKKKQQVRQAFARGEASREELLEVEAQSYHSAGTCTFYGTANSNQLLMEIMGLQLPGSSFVHPHDPLRDGLTQAAVRAVLGAPPLWKIVTARAVVNAVVGLLASGGSTNHTIHLIAMAKAAGLVLDWEDFAALSAVVPLLCRIYPNGEADINHFHAAGGTACLIGQLLDAGLLWEAVETIAGPGLGRYRQEPYLQDGAVAWREGATRSLDTSVLANGDAPFSPEGGMALVQGNLGRAVFKTSAVKPEHWVVEAPARVFESQEAVIEAFKAGELSRDVVVVLVGQGPRANGMPELHALMPSLGSVLDAGHKIALVTDGRLSGASGKVPSAIHVTPEAVVGGMLARVRDGDVVRLDAWAGVLEVKADLPQREAALAVPDVRYGLGRELFTHLRHAVTQAEEGASFIL